MRAPLRSVFVSLFSAGLLAVAGCAPSLRQVYPGAPRSLGEVGVLQDGINASVYAIDGIRVTGNRFAVLPGWHSVWLKVKFPTPVAGMLSDVWSFCHAPFDAVAGGRYRIDVQARKVEASDQRAQVVRSVQLVDAYGQSRGAAQTCSSDAPQLGDRFPILDMLAGGTWGWPPGGDKPTCEEKPHTFEVSEDGRTLDFRSGDDAPVPYRILDRTRAWVRVRDVESDARTDRGDPLEWTLFQLSSRSYCWHRTDWPPNACTVEIQICSH